MARRLLLSYLAVIGVTVALLALIVRLATLQTFSRYLSDQAGTHSEMLPVMLSGYYTAHATWEGVQPDIDQASILIGAQVTLADTQGLAHRATDRARAQMLALTSELRLRLEPSPSSRSPRATTTPASSPPKMRPFRRVLGRLKDPTDESSMLVESQCAAGDLLQYGMVFPKSA